MMSANSKDAGRTELHPISATGMGRKAFSVQEPELSKK